MGSANDGQAGFRNRRQRFIIAIFFIMTLHTTHVSGEDVTPLPEGSFQKSEVARGERNLMSLTLHDQVDEDGIVSFIFRLGDGLEKVVDLAVNPKTLPEQYDDFDERVNHNKYASYDLPSVKHVEFEGPYDTNTTFYIWIGAIDDAKAMSTVEVYAEHHKIQNITLDQAIDYTIFYGQRRYLRFDVPWHSPAMPPHVGFLMASLEDPTAAMSDEKIFEMSVKSEKPFRSADKSTSGSTTRQLLPASLTTGKDKATPIKTMYFLLAGKKPRGGKAQQCKVTFWWPKLKLLSKENNYESRQTYPKGGDWHVYYFQLPEKTENHTKYLISVNVEQHQKDTHEIDLRWRAHSSPNDDVSDARRPARDRISSFIVGGTFNDYGYITASSIETQQYTISLEWLYPTQVEPDDKVSVKLWEHKHALISVDYTSPTFPFSISTDVPKMMAYQFKSFGLDESPPTSKTEMDSSKGDPMQLDDDTYRYTVKVDNPSDTGGTYYVLLEAGDMSKGKFIQVPVSVDMPTQRNATIGDIVSSSISSFQWRYFRVANPIFNSTKSNDTQSTQLVVTLVESPSDVTFQGYYRWSSPPSQSSHDGRLLGSANGRFRCFQINDPDGEWLYLGLTSDYANDAPFKLSFDFHEVIDVTSHVLSEDEIPVRVGHNYGAVLFKFTTPRNQDRFVPPVVTVAMRAVTSDREDHSVIFYSTSNIPMVNEDWGWLSGSGMGEGREFETSTKIESIREETTYYVSFFRVSTILNCTLWFSMGSIASLDRESLAYVGDHKSHTFKYFTLDLTTYMPAIPEDLENEVFLYVCTSNSPKDTPQAFCLSTREPCYSSSTVNGGYAALIGLDELRGLNSTAWLGIWQEKSYTYNLTWHVALPRSQSFASHDLTVPDYGKFIMWKVPLPDEKGRQLDHAPSESFLTHVHSSQHIPHDNVEVWVRDSPFGEGDFWPSEFSVNSAIQSNSVEKDFKNYDNGFAYLYFFNHNLPHLGGSDADSEPPAHTILHVRTELPSLIPFSCNTNVVMNISKDPQTAPVQSIRFTTHESYGDNMFTNYVFASGPLATPSEFDSIYPYVGYSSWEDSERVSYKVSVSGLKTLQRVTYNNSASYDSYIRVSLASPVDLKQDFLLARVQHTGAVKLEPGRTWSVNQRNGLEAFQWLYFESNLDTQRFDCDFVQYRVTTNSNSDALAVGALDNPEEAWGFPRFDLYSFDYGVYHLISEDELGESEEVHRVMWIMMRRGSDTEGFPQSINVTMERPKTIPFASDRSQHVSLSSQQWVYIAVTLSDRSLQERRPEDRIVVFISPDGTGRDCRVLGYHSLGRTYPRDASQKGVTSFVSSMQPLTVADALTIAGGDAYRFTVGLNVEGSGADDTVTYSDRAPCGYTFQVGYRSVSLPPEFGEERNTRRSSTHAMSMQSGDWQYARFKLPNEAAYPVAVIRLTNVTCNGHNDNDFPIPDRDSLTVYISEGNTIPNITDPTNRKFTVSRNKRQFSHVFEEPLIGQNYTLTFNAPTMLSKGCHEIAFDISMDLNEVEAVDEGATVHGAIAVGKFSYYELNVPAGPVPMSSVFVQLDEGSAVPSEVALMGGAAPSNTSSLLNLYVGSGARPSIDNEHRVIPETSKGMMSVPVPSGSQKVYIAIEAGETLANVTTEEIGFTVQAVQSQSRAVMVGEFFSANLTFGQWVYREVKIPPESQAQVARMTVTCKGCEQSVRIYASQDTFPTPGAYEQRFTSLDAVIYDSPDEGASVFFAFQSLDVDVRIQGSVALPFPRGVSPSLLYKEIPQTLAVPGTADGDRVGFLSDQSSDCSSLREEDVFYVTSGKLDSALFTQVGELYMCYHSKGSTSGFSKPLPMEVSIIPDPCTNYSMNANIHPSCTGCVSIGLGPTVPKSYRCGWCTVDNSPSQPFCTFTDESSGFRPHCDAGSTTFIKDKSICAIAGDDDNFWTTGNIVWVALVCGSVFVAAIIAVVWEKRRQEMKRRQDELHMALLEDQSRKSNATDESWIIDISSLNLLRVIGSGGAGRVYLAKYSGHNVAVKELYVCSALADEDDLAEFRHEVSMLTKLHHPSVLQLFGMCSRENSKHYIVTEYCPKSLKDHLNSLNPVDDTASEYDDQSSRGISNTTAGSSSTQPVSTKSGYTGDLSLASSNKEDSEYLRLVMEVCMGMEFLHSRNIIHRDLKPANILLTKTGNVKLCDFGLAKFVAGDRGVTKTGTGTTEYMAPELLADDGPSKEANPKCWDVYSFGILLWEVYTGQTPYLAEPIHQIPARVIEGLRPEIPERCPVWLRELMGKCWDTDPMKRPSFAEIGELLDEKINSGDKIEVRWDNLPM